MADTTAHRFRPAWLAPVAALAIGYAIGHYRSVNVPTSTTPARDVAAATASAAAKFRAHPRTATPAVMPAAVPAMPTRDIPLAQSFDALAARARAGDAAASMRLLHEVGLCKDRPTFELIASGDAASAMLLLDDGSADAHRTAAVEAYAERVRTHARAQVAAAESLCAEVTAAELATLGEWLERASDSGDPGAELCYVVAATSDDYAPPDRYGDDWVEWMEHYRARAYTYAERAFAAGYPQASLYLYYVAAGPYVMPGLLLDHDLPSDPARAYAIALLQAELGKRATEPVNPFEISGWQEMVDTLGADLDTAAITRAQKWSDAQARRLGAMTPPATPCGIEDAL